MSVLDHLPEHKPITLLREVDQVSREIKSAQTRSSASVINYRLSSAAPYDLTVPGDFAKNVVMVEFLPDNMQFGGSLCYRAYVVVNPGSPGEYIDIFKFQRLRVVNNRQQWKYNISTFSATNLKFYFFAQAPGAFTANLI